MRLLAPSLALLSLALPAAARGAKAAEAPAPTVKDGHSYANALDVRTSDLALDLTVDFERKVLEGTATHTLLRANPRAAQFVLDTKDLTILKVEVSADGKAWSPTPVSYGKPDPLLGTKLEVVLPPGAKQVRVHYRTSPQAGGLQWLTPEQTAGKKHPYLFSQSQPILARSWVPCQDTPGVRITYSARLRTPKALRAVMSAANDPKAPRTGVYTFKMPQRVPTYLLALAVGDLEFQSLGKRSGVYAEPSVLPLAAKELEDTETMIAAAEKLYGPYRWGRYDILVCPPSFPIGGMENPRLTFATPTILAGDKSLVSLVAHELAHSWSGNLVSNATWRDVWLNEGTTTYVERRIIEALYGRPRAEMEAAIGRKRLEDLLPTLPGPDTVMNLDLQGRDPDDALSEIPYEKGSLFLRHLEETYGRAAFDAWLRSYFDAHAFRSITTADFEAHLKAHLLDKAPAKQGVVPVMAWIHVSGLPGSAPQPRNEAFSKVEAALQPWLAGTAPPSSLPGKTWTTFEWIHALTHLPATLTAAQMTELDAAFALTETGNAEVAHCWLRLAVQKRYAPAYPRLERYLVGIGRKKLILPLYADLKKSGQLDLARALFAKARPGYHPITQSAVASTLK